MTDKTRRNLIKAIKLEWLFDRTTKLVRALATVDYYGDPELKEFCLRQS